MPTSNEAQPSLPPSSAEIASQNHASKKMLWLMQIPAVIIALAALISVFYVCYDYHRLKKQQVAQTQTLNSQISHVKQEITATRDKLDTITQTTQQLQAGMSEQLKKLDGNLQTALQQRLYQKQDWLLLKARYYLELAQINAHWSSNQQTTIALLQQADTLLATLSEQQLLTIRQTIAQEIATLKAMPKLDIAGLLSQLDAAQNTASELPFNQMIGQTQAQETEQLKTQATSAWQQRLHDSMGLLQKLVVVRRNDEDIKPLLSPLHQALLRESIRLNLQEAQWAILENNTAVYHNALTQAIQDIRRTFKPNANNTQALLKQLQTLQKVELTVSTPSIDKSLQLLNQFIDNKNAISPPAQGGTTP